jgi:hypothetical protein
MYAAGEKQQREETTTARERGVQSKMERESGIYCTTIYTVNELDME